MTSTLDHEALLARAGEEFLQHYGVKGMKWGVRKNEPAVNRVPSAATTKVGSNEAAPIIALGAVYAAVLLGAMVSTHLDSGKRTQKKTKNIPWKVDPSLTGKKSIDEIHSKVVKPINANYGAKGTKMNCRRCTFAYEMRRRGMDVKATTSKFATGQDTGGLRKAMGEQNRPFQSVWGEKQIGQRNTMYSQSAKVKSDLIFNSLAQHPDGARGELGVAWMFGGGHSMAWEIVGNKPVIFDTQNGKTYRDSSQFESFASTVSDAASTRLDNARIDDAFIRRWVQNVD